MSDTMQAPDQAPIDDGSASEGQDRRKLLLIGAGVVGLVVVLGAVYFLFLSGGSSEEEFVPAPSASSGAAVEPETEATEVVKPPKFNAANASDPFQPLAVEAVVVVAEPDTNSGSGSNNGGSNNSGGSGSPTPTQPPTTQPTTQPTNEPTDPEPVTKYRVTVKSVDVKKDQATITVNGKRYVVDVKQNFPSTDTGPFRLVRVGELPSGKATATVVFGSDVPVELPVNQTETFSL